jgi:hypothetical protein
MLVCPTGKIGFGDGATNADERSMQLYKDCVFTEPTHTRENPYTEFQDAHIEVFVTNVNNC